MQQILQLPHQRAHAAAGEEILHVTVADRLQVHHHPRRVRQLVEPPIASSTRSAFSTDFAVMMTSGVSLEPISLTASAPVASAARSRSACTAGMAAVPGSTMPSASTRQAMVEAVPITAQVPAVVASLPSTSLISLSSTLPARYCAQNRRQSVQAPSRSPW